MAHVHHQYTINGETGAEGGVEVQLLRELVNELLVHTQHVQGGMYG